MTHSFEQEVTRFALDHPWVGPRWTMLYGTRSDLKGIGAKSLCAAAPQRAIPGEMVYTADSVAPAALVPPESGAEGARRERERY